MMMMAPLQSGPFATVGELPLHPLVVHVPVVVLPLTALLLILAAAIPAVRRRFLGLAVLGAVIGLIGTFLSLRSGQAFAETVGLPAAHAAAAQRLLWTAVALAVLSVAWWVLARRAGRDAAGPLAAGQDAAPAGSSPARTSSSGALATVLGAVTAAASILVLVFAVQTGHTGARAAWSGTVSGSSAGAAQQEAMQQEAMQQDQPSGAGSAAPSGSGADGATGYTTEEVSTHDSTESCWTVIDGQVYDLTEWIGRHPGGQRAIESLCGVDGTAAFQSNHDGDQRAGDQLSEYQIGTLTS